MQAWVDCSACRFFRLHRPLWYSVPEQICISSSTWGLAPWKKCILKIGHMLYTNRHLLTYLLVATSFTRESNNQLSSSLNIERKSERKNLNYAMAFNLSLTAVMCKSQQLLLGLLPQYWSPFPSFHFSPIFLPSPLLLITSHPPSITSRPL